jgi:uncharacterized Ntn-hydrolase superfamily protein
VLVDLRVDDHEEPVAELARLLDLHDLVFGRPDPDTLLDLDGPLASEVTRLLSERGYSGEPAKALQAWAGRENLELRLAEGKIDPVVLEFLRGPVAGAGGAGG